MEEDEMRGCTSNKIPRTSLDQTSASKQRQQVPRRFSARLRAKAEAKSLQTSPPMANNMEEASTNEQSQQAPRRFSARLRAKAEAKTLATPVPETPPQREPEPMLLENVADQNRDMNFNQQVNNDEERSDPSESDYGEEQVFFIRRTRCRCCHSSSSSSSSLTSSSSSSTSSSSSSISSSSSSLSSGHELREILKEQCFCDTCGTEYDSKEDLDYHSRNDRCSLYRCGYCSDKSYDRLKIEDHIENCPLKKYKCSYCKKSFSSQEEFAEHDCESEDERDFSWPFWWF